MEENLSVNDMGLSDWMQYLNNMALSWYSAVAGQPVSTQTSTTPTGGVITTTTTGPKAYGIDSNTLFWIAVLVLVAIYFMRK